MDEYFTAFGDHISNSEEIHLDNIEITTIWREFCNKVGEERSVCLQKCAEMWSTCFPHVKIREVKACCGKRTICMLLSDARQLTRDRNVKRYIKCLFALHILMYMGERASYGNRRRQAMEDPSNYLSTISDGMATVSTINYIIIISLKYIFL